VEFPVGGMDREPDDYVATFRRLCALGVFDRGHAPLVADVLEALLVPDVPSHGLARSGAVRLDRHEPTVIAPDLVEDEPSVLARGRRVILFDDLGHGQETLQRTLQAAASTS
jgi:hypothetical protein